ncbi:hypothetical protein Tco_1290078, partial [Tanacetum coccineum]
KLNYTILHLLLYEMVTYVNVLKSRVLDIVAAESDNTFVITIQRYKGLKTEQKRVLSAKTRSSLLISRDQDEVGKIHRACQWTLLQQKAITLLLSQYRGILLNAKP